MHEDEKTVTIKFLLQEENQVPLDTCDFDELYREFPLTARPLTEILVGDLGIDFEIIIDNMTAIPARFCADVDSLTALNLNSRITRIGDGAFSGCESLKSVTISDSTTSIGANAFEDCHSLTDVRYSGTASQWASISFDNDYANPVFYAENLYLDGTLAKNITLESITEIGSYAFQDCTSLKSVTIGSSVTSIGSNAFWGCKHLKSITIPNSVMSIGEYAFGCCASLVINYGGTTARFGEITDWGWNAMSKEITLRSISGSLVYR